MGQRGLLSKQRVVSCQSGAYMMAVQSGLASKNLTQCQLNNSSSVFIQAGEHEADPVVKTRSRITTSDAYQATRVSSPHAAAATRRFLAVNTSTSRAAGEALICLAPRSCACIQTIYRALLPLVCTRPLRFWILFSSSHPLLTEYFSQHVRPL